MRTNGYYKDTSPARRIPKAVALVFMLFFLFGNTGFQNSEKPDEAASTPSPGNAFLADSLCALELYEQAAKALRSNEPGNALQDVEEAIRLFEEVVQQTSDSTVWESYIFALFDWAQLNGFHYKDMQGALQTFEKGYQIALERFGEEYKHLSFFITKIGHVYAQMGDFETAVIYHRKAFEHRKKYLEEHEFYHLAGYLNLIYGLSGEGRYEEALLYIDTARMIVEKYHRNTNFESSIHSSYGNAFRGMGKYELALDSYKKALKVARAQNSSSAEGAMLIGMGDIYIAIGDQGRARQLYLQGVSLLEQFYGAEHPYLSRIYIKASQQMSAAGDKGAALEYALSAVHAVAPQFPADWRENPTPGAVTESVGALCALYTKAEALKRLAEQDGKQEMLAKALKTYELLFSLVDSRLQQFRSERTKRDFCDVQESWVEGAIEAAVRLFEWSKDSAFLEQAFQLSEKGKAYTLLQNLRIAQGREEFHLPDSLKMADINFRKAISEVEKKIFEAQQESGKAVTPGILSLENELFALKRSYDSLILVNEARYPYYWRLRKNISPPSIADVQKRLLPGEGLLQYFWGDEHIYLFLITNKHYEFHYLENDSSLLETVEGLKENINLGEDFVSGSHAVYEQLVAPLLQGGNLNRLHIIPDGILFYVPFEILLTQDVAEDAPNLRQLPYLIKELPVSYEYSSALFLEHGGSGNEVSQYLGVAPQYQPTPLATQTGRDSLYTNLVFRNVRSEITPLAFNVPEVLEASEGLPGENLSGPIATEAQFKAKAPDFDILHLAMHAHTNDLDPSYSWMVFSNAGSEDADSGEDGLLHAYEIANMKLKAQLAVLSACNTGAGPVRKGEGVMSLARAFKYAGCPNVVMSLWPANDASTGKIITLFFEKLKQGLPKDQALQESKLDFLQSVKNEYYTHPFYWAGLVLVGDEAPVCFHRSRWRMALLLSAGIGVLGLCLFLYRRKKNGPQ